MAIDELYAMCHGHPIAFRGERAISSALAELSMANGHAIYFLVGHGECELDSTSPSRGLSSLKHACAQRNYVVRSLDLCETKAIPPDAAAIVSVGARNDLLGFEKELLRDFVDNGNGKLVVALDGNFAVGLKEFLADYGLCVGVNSLVPRHSQSASYSDDLVINRFSPHAINGRNIDLRLPVIFGISHEVKRAPWATEEDKFEITELLQTGDGVLEYGDDGEAANGAAYVVGAIAERRKFGDSAATANVGRVLAIGNGDFVANGKIPALGNRVLWFGIGDYMLPNVDGGAFEDIRVENYRLALSKEDFNGIMTLVCVPPTTFLALAILVAIRRRR
jgi:hypothetical protein